jgi:ribose 5-phosphate isomerase RpiB
MNLQYIIYCIDGEKIAVISKKIDKETKEKIERELKDFGCKIINNQNKDEIRKFINCIKQLLLIQLSEAEGEENGE